MLLARLVEASQRTAATRSRLAKVEAVAHALREAGPGDVGLVTAYLSGVVPQRRLGVGWRGLSAVPEAATTPALTVGDVDEAFSRLAEASGPGSAGARADVVQELLARATAPEQAFLRALITGGLRQGALDGIMLVAIASATGVPELAVRRAVMLAGHAAPVAEAAAGAGLAAVEAIGLEVGRPVRPMLAGSAPDVPAGWQALGADTVVIDAKLDGIRLQAHKNGSAVRLFTRSLEEITERLPEVVEIVGSLPGRRLVLDGEAIALRDDGRPHPFQVTGSRTASTTDPLALRSTTPVTTFFFDLLHRDGVDLIDAPALERFAALDEVAGTHVVPRLVTTDPGEAAAFFADVVAQGHEGVVLKSGSAPYAAGRRGAGWVKVKPRHTLDLVVLAVEWGSGRRQGWLSNIHLGARDADGGFVMLGKTFKGMTDEMLTWQTERFLELETARSGHVVQVRPEQVVEIAFDGLQRSSRYSGGLALRFARVVRYRDDKGADEADTIDTVRSLA